MIIWSDDSRVDLVTFRLFLAKIGPCIIQLYGYEGESLEVECIFSEHLLDSNSESAKAAVPALIRAALQKALVELDSEEN